MLTGGPPGTTCRTFEPKRQALMKAVLEQMATVRELSKETAEVTAKALA